MLRIYEYLIGLLFLLGCPFLLAAVLVTGRHRRGLAERLGLGRVGDGGLPGRRRIWIHAASIGEVKAASVLIGRLESAIPNCSFVVTTMTVHGRDLARDMLPASIPCLLAPLDVPLVTGRAIDLLRPDIYVCLETELWPVLVGKLVRRGVPLVLLNGRLSDRSIDGYRRWRWFFQPIVRSFSRIGAISDIDRQRFIDLGANPAVVSVTGNIKNDIVITGQPQDTEHRWRRTLGLEAGMDVFIAASTHDPEERLLLPLYRRFGEYAGQVWLMAPRHLNRLAALERLFDTEGIRFDRLSQCLEGTTRRASLVLVDTMGDLAGLFAVASIVFVGGSLVDRGGHNLIEAASWQKPVLFGPYVQDFQDAAVDLAAAGGGFQVGSIDELADCIETLRNDPGKRITAGQRAGAVASRRQGAGIRQAELVVEVFNQVNTGPGVSGR